MAFDGSTNPAPRFSIYEGSSSSCSVPPRLEYRMLWISHNHSLSPSVEERVQWGRGRETICVEEIHLPISSRSCAESRTKVYGSIAAAFVGKAFVVE